MASLTQRMIGAARLDVATYEEVEADQTATGQAMAVVLLGAVAAGIGAIGDAGIGGIVMATIGALVGWVLWAAVVWLVGTKILPEPGTSADIGELLRTLGFASSPGVLRVAGIIPVIGVVVNLVVALWMLVAMVIAVRQALDYTSTGRAVVVCLIGFVINVVVMAAVAVLFGGAAMAGGALFGS